MLRSAESEMDACPGHPNRKWTHASAVRAGNGRMLRSAEPEMDACSGHPNRELTHAPAVRNGHRRMPRSSELGIDACFEGPTGRTGRLAGGATSTYQANAERGTIRETGYTPPRACGPLCRSEDRRSRARVPWGLRAMRGPRCRSGRMPRSSEPEMDACSGQPNRKWTHAPVIRTGNGRMLRPSEPEMDACSGQPNRKWTHAPAIRSGNRRMPLRAGAGMDACSTRPTRATALRASPTTHPLQWAIPRFSVWEGRL